MQKINAKNSTKKKFLFSFGRHSPLNFPPAKQNQTKTMGTTDDCGFSPFDDDQSTSRQICLDKIRARIEGTHMAEEQLMLKR